MRLIICLHNVDYQPNQPNQPNQPYQPYQNLKPMRTTLLLFCLYLAVPLSAQSNLSGTILSGGLTREYLLYVPAVYTGATAVPLIINLHGYTSSNVAQEFYGDFRPIADTANFLIVHPNGTIDDQGNRFWNTFGGNSTVDDVGFIAQLIDSLRAVYNIDPNRIYATGMSNGGFMSYQLACDLNNRIAAIASVTGSKFLQPPDDGLMADVNPVKSTCCDDGCFYHRGFLKTIEYPHYPTG